MKLEHAAALALAIGLLVAGLGAFVFYTNSGGTTYEYTVKTEQVETDAGYTGNSTPISDLSVAKQDAIFDAFKKSDHFLGSSSSQITRGDPLELTRTELWDTIEVEGVTLLVGITGPDTYPIEPTPAVFFGLFFFMLGSILALVALTAASDSLPPRLYR